MQFSQPSFYLESPKTEEASSTKSCSLCGGTKNICVAVSLAETINLCLLDPVFLERNPTNGVKMYPDIKKASRMSIRCSVRLTNSKHITKCEFFRRQSRCRKSSHKSRCTRNWNNKNFLIDT